MHPADAFSLGVDLRVYDWLETVAEERAALGQVDERELVRDPRSAVAHFKVEPLPVRAVLDVRVDQQLILVA